MVNIIDVMVYFFLFFILPITIYLRKTGKTFIELVKEIIEFFKELFPSEE